MLGLEVPTVECVTSDKYLMGSGGATDEGCRPFCSPCHPCSPDDNPSQCYPDDDTCYPDCGPCGPCSPCRPD